MSESQSLFGSVPATGCYQDPSTGRPVTLTNPAKFAHKSFWLPSTPRGTVLAANAGAIVAWTPPRDQGDQGDTEGFKLMAQSTGQFAVRMYSEVLDRYHSNRPVESSLIFGDGNFPGELLETLYIPATSSVRLELTDLSAAPNTVDMTVYGKQVLNPIGNIGRNRLQLIRANQKQNTHAYWLTFNDGPRVTVGANATATFSMTVPGDAEFNAWQLLARSDQGVNSFTVELREGQRRSLMGVAAQNIGLVGAQTFAFVGSPSGVIPAAGVPFILSDTHLFERNTIIDVILTDVSGNPNAISMALAGQLIYYPRSPGGLVPLGENAAQLAGYGY